MRVGGANFKSILAHRYMVALTVFLCISYAVMKDTVDVKRSG